MRGHTGKAGRCRRGTEALRGSVAEKDTRASSGAGTQGPWLGVGGARAAHRSGGCCVTWHVREGEEKSTGPRVTQRKAPGGHPRVFVPRILQGESRTEAGRTQTGAQHPRQEPGKAASASRAGWVAPVFEGMFSRNRLKYATSIAFQGAVSRDI